MTELDPAGLGAAAKAVAAYVGWPPGFRRDAEAAVRAYLASLPPDAEKNPYGPASHTSADTAWDEGYAEGFAAGRAAATPDPPDPRLDAVYAERNAVVLGLAKAGLMLGWRVGKASDPNEPDWPVVYIDTPAGQVSWHFRAADVPDWVEPYPGEWDRHSDREKYERLSRLPAAPAATPDPPRATPRSELRRMAAMDGVCPICHTATSEPPEWEQANCSQKHRIRELEAELAELRAASPDERLREAAGLLSRAKTALRAHRLNWLALSDRLDAPYPDRPDSSPWSRFALPVCQRGKAVEDEIVAALAVADREAPDEETR